MGTRPVLILFCVQILCVIFLYMPAHCQVPWTGSGPEGGSICSFAVSPANSKIIYAGTGGGVFKSTDGGMSWGPVNTGLGATNVFSLAVNPSSVDMPYLSRRTRYRQKPRISGKRPVRQCPLWRARPQGSL